jgi:hypothetical protein
MLLVDLAQSFEAAEICGYIPGSETLVFRRLGACGKAVYLCKGSRNWYLHLPEDAILYTDDSAESYQECVRDDDYSLSGEGDHDAKEAFSGDEPKYLPRISASSYRGHRHGAPRPDSANFKAFHYKRDPHPSRRRSRSCKRPRADRRRAFGR